MCIPIHLARSCVTTVSQKAPDQQQQHTQQHAQYSTKVQWQQTHACRLCNDEFCDVADVKSYKCCQKRLNGIWRDD
eukprot:16537-Heterococcus_DN1.PRE.3